MNLLREYVRMILEDSDSEYFGAPFVEFKQRIENGEDPLDVADEILTYVGKGSTRVVYGIPGNNDQVVKIVNTRVASHPDRDDMDIHSFSKLQKQYSNLWESDLEMQQKYPNVFPRTYEASTDGSWILAERVLPLNGDKSRFFEILGLSSQDVQNINADAWQMMIELIKEHIVNENDPSHYSHKYVLEEAVYETFADDSTYVNDIDGSSGILDADTQPISQDDTSSSFKVSDKTDEKPYGYDMINRRIKAILSNPHHRGIIKAMAELGIPAREFTPKNVGISNLGGEHLVILDASLWSEK